MAKTPIKLQIVATSMGLKVLDDTGRSLSNIYLQSQATSKGLKALGFSFGTLTKYVSAALGAIIGFKVARKILESFVEINKSLELLEVRLAGFMGSSHKATMAMREMFDMSARTGYGIDRLAKSFTQMEISGLSPMRGSMRDLTEAVAALGGTEDDLTAVTRAIMQMAGKGVISMEEIRQQMAERLPQSMVFFAKAYGKTMTEFIRDVSRGKVTAELLPKAIKMMGEAYRGATERIFATTSGQWNRLKAQYQILVRTLGQQGVWTTFGAVLKVIGDRINVLVRGTGNLDAWGRVIDGSVKAIIWAFAKLAEVIGKVVSGFARFMDIVSGGVSLAEQFKKGREALEKYRERLISLQEVYKRFSDPATTEKVKKTLFSKFDVSGIEQAGDEIDWLQGKISMLEDLLSRPGGFMWKDFLKLNELERDLSKAEGEYSKWADTVNKAVTRAQKEWAEPRAEKAKARVAVLSAELEIVKRKLSEPIGPTWMDDIYDTVNRIDAKKFMEEIEKAQKYLKGVLTVKAAFEVPDVAVMTAPQLDAYSKFTQQIATLETAIQSARVAGTRKTEAAILDSIERQAESYRDYSYRILENFLVGAKDRVEIEKKATDELGLMGEERIKYVEAEMRKRMDLERQMFKYSKEARTTITEWEKKKIEELRIAVREKEKDMQIELIGIQKGALAQKLATYSREYEEQLEVYRALNMNTDRLWTYYIERAKYAYAQSRKDSQEYLRLQLQNLIDQGASIREQHEAIISFMEDTSTDWTKGFEIGLRRTHIEFTQWTRTISESISQLTNTISNSFGAAFADVISGTKNMKEAFAAMGESIVRNLLEIIGRMIAMWMISRAIKGLGTAFGIELDIGKYLGGLSAGSDIGVGVGLGPGFVSEHEGGIIGSRYHKGGVINPEGRTVKYHDGGLIRTLQKMVRQAVKTPGTGASVIKTAENTLLQWPWRMLDLKPREVPVIAEINEAIIPKRAVERNREIIERLIREGGSKDILREIVTDRIGSPMGPARERIFIAQSGEVRIPPSVVRNNREIISELIREGAQRTFLERSSMIAKSTAIPRFHDGGLIGQSDASSFSPMITPARMPIPMPGRGITQESIPPEIHIHNEGPPLRPTRTETRREQRKLIYDLWLEEVGANAESRRKAARVTR